VMGNWLAQLVKALVSPTHVRSCVQEARVRFRTDNQRRYEQNCIRHTDVWQTDETTRSLVTQFKRTMAHKRHDKIYIDDTFSAYI